MHQKIRVFVAAAWRWFRGQSLFIQALIAVPLMMAVLFTALIGNMGLALMGGAVALYAPITGAIVGAVSVVLTKASAIVIRDRKQGR
ncbi:hypothetical protein [Frigidibacter sp. MR17.24]|uniref:hypothetical protein n=1 Tax=Frigidibacter sp. MR17.24 TaxID=3127345 RepID=UPI003012B1C1